MAEQLDGFLLFLGQCAEMLEGSIEGQALIEQPFTVSAPYRPRAVSIARMNHAVTPWWGRRLSDASVKVPA